MSIFQSQINPNSDEFQHNRAGMLKLIERTQQLEARTRQASARAKARFARRKQLMPHERVARLLDPGAPFLEIGNMTGYLRDTDDPDKSLPGASLIAGIGFIDGVRCMIVANDSSINAGAISEATGQKLSRSQDIALQHKLRNTAKVAQRVGKWTKCL